MREQLIQYVQLLFAGAADCDDTRQEILQNTLDRYDDLVAAGKTPEAAYRLAIMGIGDINEILGRAPGATPLPAPAVKPEEQDTPVKKLLRAIAIGLYILCPIPLFVLSGMLNMGIPGLCGTLTLVAVATVLIILGAKKETENADVEPGTPQSALVKSINGLIWAIGLAIYFIVSFLTGAWYITWVIFPITAAVQGLVKAILDLKEDK
ncbi:MAG: hypothetical protein KHX05_02370 [Firmicutes bacterium]|nr:hypothetical protein [Bacillota bacterium]